MINSYKKVFFTRSHRANGNLFFGYIVFLMIFIMPSTILSEDNSYSASKENNTWDYSQHVIAQLNPQTDLMDNNRSTDLEFGKQGDATIAADKTGKWKFKNVTASQIDHSKITETEPTQDSQPNIDDNETKQVYHSTVKKYHANKNQQINISEPTFTDFNIVKGYRSFEETIAVGSESKRIIQRCLDRYFRLHPRFRGKIVVKFDVHPEGYIIDESLKIVYSDIAYEPVMLSIRKSILRWVSYPEVPLESGIYSVTQKYIF